MAGHRLFTLLITINCLSCPFSGFPPNQINDCFSLILLVSSWFGIRIVNGICITKDSLLAAKVFVGKCSSDWIHDLQLAFKGKSCPVSPCNQALTKMVVEIVIYILIWFSIRTCLMTMEKCLSWFFFKFFFLITNT